MEVKLMNFGDATRVVHDSRNKPVIVTIGGSKHCDLAHQTIHTIRRNMDKGDTLLIVPEGVTPPARLMQITELLRNIGELPYADLLPRFHAIIGKTKTENMRPNMPTMRDALMHEALSYCRQAVQALELDLPPADQRKPGSEFDELGGLSGLLGNRHEGGGNAGDEGNGAGGAGNDGTDGDGERDNLAPPLGADLADQTGEQVTKPPRAPKTPRAPSTRKRAGAAKADKPAKKTGAATTRVRLNG